MEPEVETAQSQFCTDGQAWRRIQGNRSLLLASCEELIANESRRESEIKHNTAEVSSSQH